MVSWRAGECLSQVMVVGGSGVGESGVGESGSTFAIRSRM